DLQWADELTRGFLEFLAERPAAFKHLLVFGTCRTEEVEPLFIDSPAIVRIALDRLDQSSVGDMVCDMLALRRPPEIFVRFLTRHSEGNPFFVAEYLRTAVAERILHRDAAGLWQVEAAAEGAATEALYEALPLPGSVRELVGRRLDRLSAEARAPLGSAPGLGREARR